MNSRNCLLLCCFVLFTAISYADVKTGNVKGRLYNPVSKQYISDAQIILPSIKLLTTPDQDGYFSISELPYGIYTLEIDAGNPSPHSITISVDTALSDLGLINIEVTHKQEIPEQLQVPVTTIEEDTRDEAGISQAQAAGTVLNGTNRDPFITTTGFVLSPYNFHPRGYHQGSRQVLINGAIMNDMATGNPAWSSWSGLNDVFRNTHSSYGLSMSEYTFGNINGAVHYLINTLEQAKQYRVSYALSNRQYNNRLMLTYTSGPLWHGWAYAVSASKRWSGEGYIPGTFYDGYSWFVSAGKQLGKYQQCNMMIFGAPLQRGKQGIATEEVYTLAGSNYYNPNWGWQDGRKRNARVASSHQPVFMLTHQYNRSKNMQWLSSVSYQFGKYKNSSLDWYKGSDPRPDYYRYLPSYYAAFDTAVATAVKTGLMNDPARLQIDWDRLYNANYNNKETLHDVNGIPGNDVTGNRSIYVIGNDVVSTRKISLNSLLSVCLPHNVSLYTGIHYRFQRSQYYKELADLLGADYFIDNNMFAEQQYAGIPALAQSNLLQPNRPVYTGDQYEYHYTIHQQKTGLWLQLLHSRRKTDMFITFQSTASSIYREGLYKNGLYPAISHGNSEVLNFITGSVKAGLTYKINGRNFLLTNIALTQEEPGLDNVFVSPRMHNLFIEHPQVQNTRGYEGGYLYKSPRLNIRSVFYMTEIKSATQIQRFYNDDPDYQAFVNYVMQNINMRFQGTELAIEYKANSMLTLSAIAALGQAFYTNRPYVTIYTDNDTNLAPQSQQPYIKNYYIASGPQSAYSLGLAYNGKSYWYSKINFSFLDRNYVAINPVRRTAEAAGMLQNDNLIYSKIYTQEKLPAIFTIDLSGGISYRLNKASRQLPYGLTLNVNIGISNLLNHKDMKTGGYEQLRYDFTNHNPGKFPNKYFYSYGSTFFANISIKL